MMNEAPIEAALRGLGSQAPRAPEPLVTDMVKTVKMLNRERIRRLGVVPEQPQKRRQRELTAGNPVKTNKPKVL